MQFDVSGKHAVVTGGSRGIGHAAAAELVRRGARVSVLGRSLTTGASDGGFFHAQADVTDEAQIARALDACRAANGPIAILVNNAGIAESAPLARTGKAMWDRIIATNLTGTFLCTRAVVQDMLIANWGRVVNVASIAGLYGAAYISAYVASKHGVVGFTRAIAQEFAGTGVTANAICPGYVETDMMRRAIANIVKHTGLSENAAREHLAQGNPQGRIVAPEEVAAAIVACCEGDANGQEIVL